MIFDIYTQCNADLAVSHSICVKYQDLTPYRQQGVALLTVMLIITLATIAAVAMVSRQQIDIRRTVNVLNHEQAYQYLLGAEDWAKYVLVRDFKDNKTDSFADDWATVLPPILVEGGQVSGSIEDMQGRFNINNLIVDDEISQVDLERFKRLLAGQELPTKLANAVIDWLDANEDTTFPDGGEDVEYLAQERPYRAANGFMASPSELLKVNGFTYEIYMKLLPSISTLPEYTSINVNTAPATVLVALAEGLDEADAEELITARDEKGFDKLDDFAKHAVFTGRKLDKKGLAVASNHFLMTATAFIGKARSRLQSVLYRAPDGKVRAVLRSQGGL